MLYSISIDLHQYYQYHTPIRSTFLSKRHYLPQLCKPVLEQATKQLQLKNKETDNHSYT